MLRLLSCSFALLHSHQAVGLPAALPLHLSRPAGNSLRAGQTEGERKEPPMQPHYRMYIDGEWTNAASGRTLGIINPATEEIITDVPYGGKEDTKRAVAAASRAFPGWAGKTAYERAAVLAKTGALLRERLEEIARVLSMEEGKTLLESRGEIAQSAGNFEWMAEEAKRA